MAVSLLSLARCGLADGTGLSFLLPARPSPTHPPPLAAAALSKMGTSRVCCRFELSQIHPTNPLEENEHLWLCQLIRPVEKELETEPRLGNYSKTTSDLLAHFAQA